MYIVNVVQDFQTGGIQKLLLEYLRYFKNNPDVKYQVIVLEKNRASAFEKVAEEEQLDIVYLNAERSNNNHYYIRKCSDFYNYNIKLYHFLRKNKPDIVHTHNSRIFARIKYCMKWIAPKKVIVHSLHSDPFAVTDLHVPIVKRMFSMGVSAICLNNTQFEKAKQRYGLDKCDILYNVIDVKRFDKCAYTKKETRKLLKLPTDAYVIGTVGRMEIVKNYSFLIDIFANVTKIREDAVLVFCGDGSEMDHLKQKANKLGINDKVYFLGVRNDVENVYKAIDTFVMVSLTESSSIALIEAQIVGCMCVIAPSVPVESIITDRVVRMNENASLDEWTLEVSHPKDFSKSLATQIEYSIEFGAKKMLNIYREKLEREKHG